MQKHKHKRKPLPPPRPPTSKELREQLAEKARADYEMQWYDNFSPYLRAACKKYACTAWQVAALLNHGYSEEAIVAVLKRENGES